MTWLLTTNEFFYHTVQTTTTLMKCCFYWHKISSFTDKAHLQLYLPILNYNAQLGTLTM